MGTEGNRNGEISMEELKDRCPDLWGSGQAGGVLVQEAPPRAQEVSPRVQELQIQVHETQYRPQEPIRVHEVPFWQPKPPIRPPETRLYQEGYSNIPIVVMAERDFRVDNRKVEFLANDFQDLQQKREDELEEIRIGQRFAREEIRYSLDSLRQKITTLRADLNDQLDAAKGFTEQKSTCSDRSPWEFDGPSSGCGYDRAYNNPYLHQESGDGSGY